MDDLAYELKQLCHRNRDGGHKTQAQRMQSLKLIAKQLKEAGFDKMRATSLKGKHVDALVDRWKAEKLSAGTIKNRMSHFRFWAQKVGKAGVIPASNAALGIPQRQPSGANKAKSLDDGQLGRVDDAYVRMSLRLQQAFGLRREESIKFQPAYADRGDHIALKGSWCKGGRPRTLPITTTEQRAVLDDAQPLPEDCEHALEVRQAEQGSYGKSLSREELALSAHGDTPLGRSLAQFGRNMDERKRNQQRESARRAESKSESIKPEPD